MQGPRNIMKPVPLGALKSLWETMGQHGHILSAALWWSGLFMKRHFNQWKQLPLQTMILSCICRDKGEVKKQCLAHNLPNNCLSLVLCMTSSQPFFFPCPGHSPAAHPPICLPRPGQKGQDLTHPLHLCWFAAPPYSRPGSNRWYPHHSQPSRRQWRCWWLSLAPEVWQLVSVGLREKFPIVIHAPVFSAKLPTNSFSVRLLISTEQVQ